MNGFLVRYGNESLELTVDRINAVETRAMINDLAHAGVVLKIVIETHDEEIHLQSKYEQNKSNGTVVNG